MDSLRRIGIFGGTFNPVHIGHLALAEAAREQYGLEKVVFIPASVPPHKNFSPRIPGRDRLAMLQAAVADNPSFCVDDIELQRGGVSRTYDTLSEYLPGMPQAEIFCILGADNAVTLGSWYKIEQLLEMARFIAAARPGSSCSWHPAVTGITMPALEISSSYIRQCCASGRSIRYLVPDPVFRLIREHGWYRV